MEIAKIKHSKSIPKIMVIYNYLFRFSYLLSYRIIEDTNNRFILSMIKNPNKLCITITSDDQSATGINK